MKRLFVDQMNLPLRFFLYECTGLKCMIESYGGTVSLLNSADCIRLVAAQPGCVLSEPVHRKPVYSYTYIVDCIDAAMLLPLPEYEVRCGEIPRKKSAELHQIDINELVKFVGKFPVREPQKLYWKWVSDRLHFPATPAKLRSAYKRHVAQLRKQGFALVEKRA